MASVWIARQTGKHGFEKLVAIKTILPKFASDPGFQTMFLDEARIAARIEHANVAQVLDVGEQHGTTYLVMEYVDGEALSGIHRAVKKKGARMPTGMLLRVMADVCGGLHTAHELRGDDGQLLGVVHRDVSPQNILVNMKGVAKLIDFGIAKARDRVAGDTNAGTLKGKVRYMAPEQALGNPIDRRADVWAIGGILYHLLSGKPPYEGENDVQTLLVLTSGRPPVPLPPSVHPAISAVVKRALSAAPNKRFDTAADMQQAIEDAMVAAKLVAGPSAVSSCLAEYVGDRAQKRKDAIALGVKAAADREKYASIMRSNIKTTGGISEAGSRSGTATVGPPPIGPTDSLGPPETPSSVSKSTNGTLGLAALDVSLRRQGRSRTAAIAGVAVGAALGIAGLVTLVTRDPPERGAAKSGSADPSLSASAIRTIPVEELPTVPPAATQDAPAVPPSAAVPVPTSVVTTVAAPPVSTVTTATQVRPAPRPLAPRPMTKKRIDDGF
jgi:hypothetical protein